MPKLEYYRPIEAFGCDRDAGTVPGGIRGLAGRRATWATVGTGGTCRKPANDYLARQYVPDFRPIVKVDRAAALNAVTVFYVDGSSDVIGTGDLLCVERPEIVPATV